MFFTHPVMFKKFASLQFDKFFSNRVLLIQKYKINLFIVVSKIKMLSLNPERMKLELLVLVITY